MKPNTPLIYYLPGWGGQLRTGLGQGLLQRGCDVTGRETRGDFKQMSFSEQVTVVQNDLQQHFWHEGSRVVANSFGGYLFLHAQANLPIFPGRVLFLSPIVGGFADEATGRFFSPPKENKLMELVSTKTYPCPLRCEVHTGSEDWQSEPTRVAAFFNAIGSSITVVQGCGHMLGKDYVGNVLDKWLLS